MAIADHRNLPSPNNSPGYVMEAAGATSTFDFAYDLVVEARSTKSTEFAPGIDEGTGILPGLPPVAGG
jgi:hypothetical protein